MAASALLGKGPESVVRASAHVSSPTPVRAALVGVRQWEAGEAEMARSLLGGLG